MANRKLQLQPYPLSALLRSALTRTAAGALGAATPLMALANPSGGQVVAGSATITTPGANATVVHQGSQRAVINWQQFSVGSGEYVQFVQPNSSSAVLNRVVGGNASSIFGNITANGQVFLVNPNGIYFAPGSSVDVQGLVASTLDMDTAAFMQGRNVFTRANGAPDATVVNRGSINTQGGYVVLAGDYVENDGTINAQSGRVVLAAGNSATLTLDGNQLVSYVVDGATLAHLAGVDNAGTITADGGAVIMTADVANALTATAVNNSGLITAHTAFSAPDGAIVLLGKGGDIENSGTLDASAASGHNGAAGGTIVIRGDGHTKLTSTSKIEASGNHDHGGFIELSGHTLSVRGLVHAGKQGSLLIDPASISIVSGGASGHSPNSDSIGTTFIDGALNAGSNVAIVASTKIANTTGTGITATGTGNLTMAIGSVGGASCVGAAAACVGTGTPSIGHAQGTIDLTGLPISIAGKVTIDAAGNADSGGQITTVNVKGKTVDLTANQITVNGNLTATGGDINLIAHSGSPHVTVTGTITANNGQFTASFSNEGGAAVGTVQLNKVTALGIHVNAAIISASGTLHAIGTTGASSSKSVVLHAHGASAEAGPQIRAKKIVSDHGNINLVTAGSGSSVINVANGTQTALSAANGSVNLFTSGNSHFGGNITVTGGITGKSVSITARGLGVSGGKINITGNVVATGGNSTDLAMLAFDSVGNAAIHVTGNLTAARGITIQTEGGVGDLSVTGAIHGGTQAACHSYCVKLQASNGVLHAGGDVTATRQNVSFSGSALNFGNVTAADEIDMNAHTTANAGATIIQRTGTTLKAARMQIDLNASYGGLVSLNNLTASSANGPAGIEIVAHASQGGAQIHVGNITVNGKAAGGLSSGMPGIGLGMPVGAYLIMSASGSTGSKNSVSVTGNVNVTAHAGVVHFNQAKCLGASTCEAPGGHHPGIHGTITGGLAEVRINATGGSSQVHLVNATVKGPDAIMDVGAATITAGAVTVAGSGHTMSFDYSGSSTNAFLKNNLGNGALRLTGSTVNAGNITVTGRGQALVGIQASNANVGNIAVSATQAKGSQNGSIARASLGTTGFTGLMGFNLGSGHFSAGRAAVAIGLGVNSGGQVVGGAHPDNATTPGRGPVAQSIHAGTINVNGVGSADIRLGAASIQAKSLSAVATKGIMVGTGTSHSGGEAGFTFNNTFNINGGQADINLDGGLSSHAVINVVGSMNVAGPTGGVDLHAHTVKVSGGIAVAGSGGALDIKSVRHRSLGSSANTMHYVGPGDITGVNVGGLTSTASVNIGGTVKVKGQGLVGVSITGNKVTLGGLSASASNTAKYSVLNTSVSTTPTNFTAGSVAVLVFDGDSTTITGPATITGNLTLNATHGNVYLPGQLNVGGTVTVKAAGGITTDISPIAPEFNALSNVFGGSSGGSNSDGIPSGGIGPLTLKAGAVNLTAGGSIDLTGAAVTAAKGVTLTAAKSILLGDTAVTAGSSLTMAANGSISNGGSAGAFKAKGMHLSAKTGKISLRGESLNAGAGTALFSAAGDITITGATLAAKALGVAAGGNIDLTGDTVNVTGAVQLVAGFNGKTNGVANPLKAKDIILSGVNITAGVFEASAGGNIHNGGTTGTLKAGALSVLAGGDINLASTDITVGSGSVTGITGDQLVIAGLEAAGIAPASLAPNGTFIAGGNLVLGNYTMTGTYLYLQAATVSILGKVSVPKGTVVQAAPIDPTADMSFEDKSTNGSGFDLSNAGFLALFPQITLVLGTSAESGDAILAKNGPIDIGADNLVIATTGNITGLDLVTSTGLVTSLESILGPPVPPPTSSEIDPNSSNNGKKHTDVNPSDVTGTGADTLIHHDDQPPAGTCH